jgi:hypothetical protein
MLVSEVGFFLVFIWDLLIAIQIGMEFKFESK